MTAQAPWQWVADSAGLEALCERWRRSDCIMLDTEFVRTRTYSADLGLVQVGDGTDCWLLDPLSLPTLEPLAALFDDGAVDMVIHAGGEDLEVLANAVNTLPEPLYDTQIGAALLGMDHSLSYQKLVAELCAEDIPKGESRSDWLRRPLSDAQLEYAALDVIWLAPAFKALEERLDAKGRLDWWREDGAWMLRSARADASPQQLLERVKGVGKLEERAQQRLLAIAAWRENQARHRNKPRGWILDDEVCLALARRGADSLAALAAISGMPAGEVRRSGEVLLDVVSIGDEAAVLPPAMDNRARQVVKSMKQHVAAIAKELGVAPALLASNRELEAVFRYGDSPAMPLRCLQGWRRQRFGDDLLAIREGRA